MNWPAFWSSLLGTALPASATAVLVLLLTHRANKQLETYRGMFAAWHQRRVDALVEIYQAFREYLDFLRRQVYIPQNGGNLDPMWDFRNVLDKNAVFLDDDLHNEIRRMSSELLLFWNWAMEHARSPHGPEPDAVQNRLDHEIPKYLERLREVINRHLDPKYAPQPERHAVIISKDWSKPDNPFAHSN